MSKNNQKDKKWPQDTTEVKKMGRMPHRTQISLKARKKNIPEIKIELDQMLMQAYQQMKMQPKKNLLLGNPDLYVLDNQLLRDYVTAVYDQYGIQDPIITNHFHSVSDRLRSSTFLPSRSNFTPLKNQPIHHINQVNSKIKKAYKASEKIAHLKQQFQTELQTMPTMLIEAPKTPAKKGVLYNENRPTPKKVQIKISRRSSQIQLANSVKIEGKRKSKILNQSRHKYCLMCEELLESNQINAHEKYCNSLQQLLSTPNLTIEEVVQVLNCKIKKLTEQLQWHRSCIHEDLGNMQMIIHSQLRKYETGHKSQYFSWEEEKDRPLSSHINTEESEQFDEDHENLMKQFSQMRSIKVLEILDKVNWFNKMKMKALKKKQKTDIY